MKIFITGATGYIGGSIAVRLIEAGHHVRGLVRDRGKGKDLEELGLEPVVGDLDDGDLLAREARAADGAVNAANADHVASVRALLAGLERSGKPLLHTSGSSVVGDDARGNVAGDAVYDEDTPFVVQPGKLARHELNQSLLAAASRGVRTVVICPTLIYGAGRGLNRHSIQIPFLVRKAQEHGAVRVVGRGLNVWSTVHIDDLAELYVLALQNAAQQAGAGTGAFYFAENGETSFAQIGAAIAARLGLGAVQSITAADVTEQWGGARAIFTFGSNSRVRAVRARRDLGWRPRHASALTWIADEMVV